MLQFINDMLDVLGSYVVFLFSLEFLPGISIGSVFVVASLMFVIIETLWVRKGR